MENRQFEAMLSVAQERLAQHIPEDIAEKAGAQYCRRFVFIENA